MGSAPVRALMGQYGHQQPNHHLRMLTGHPDEAADHSVTLPPLHQVPFQACFHAYVFNVWTARGTYLVPEYCKPGGFLDTSAPHLGGEPSYTFSHKIFDAECVLFFRNTEITSVLRY